MKKKKKFIVFDTEACRIASNIKDNGVSYMSYYDSETDKIIGFFEKDVKKFEKVLNDADFVVGYNIFGYDYPVLKKYFQFDEKKLNSVDIFKLIVEQHKIFLKLDNIGTTTLNYPKVASGLDAVRFYNEGKLDKLKEYCDADVDITTQVFDFILKNGFIIYKDGLGKKIKLNIILPDFVHDQISKENMNQSGGSLF